MEKDKILEKYENEGFGKNAFGWYFNPWIDEYDKDYDPHNDKEYNSSLTDNTKGEKNPYSDLSIEELEEELIKLKEEFNKEYQFRVHEENGMEEHDGDFIVKYNEKKKLINEALEEKSKKEKEPIVNNEDTKHKREPKQKPNNEKNETPQDSNNDNKEDEKGSKDEKIEETKKSKLDNIYVSIADGTVTANYTAPDKSTYMDIAKLDYSSKTFTRENAHKEIIDYYMDSERKLGRNVDEKEYERMLNKIDLNIVKMLKGKNPEAYKRYMDAIIFGENFEDITYNTEGISSLSMDDDTLGRIHNISSEAEKFGASVERDEIKKESVFSKIYNRMKSFVQSRRIKKIESKATEYLKGRKPERKDGKRKKFVEQYETIELDDNYVIQPTRKSDTHSFEECYKDAYEAKKEKLKKLNDNER